EPTQPASKKPNRIYPRLLYKFHVLTIVLDAPMCLGYLRHVSLEITLCPVICLKLELIDLDRIHPVLPSMSDRTSAGFRSIACIFLLPFVVSALSLDTYSAMLVVLVSSK
ncbi:hypothetical protein BDV18DRAFT_142680, partial [Aspergillus unguis]